MTLSRPVGMADPSTVADELAIQRVLAWNSQAINDGDRAAYLSTFADDAIAVYWDEERRGHDAIGAYFDRTQARIKVHDTVTNVIVDVRGDKAWAVATGTSVPSEVAPPAILAQTTIETELSKDSGVWRIDRQEKRADASFDPSVLAPKPPGDNIGGAVRDGVEALRSAVVAADATALEALLDPEFVGVGFAGQVVDKARYIGIHADVGGDQGGFSEFVVENLVIAAHPDVAFVHGIQQVAARIRLRSRFVQVWTLAAKSWRLSFHQETPIVDPPSVPSNY